MRKQHENMNSKRKANAILFTATWLVLKSWPLPNKRGFADADTFNATRSASPTRPLPHTSRRMLSMCQTSKLMDHKLMKEVFDSYFELGKLYPRTICHLNILGKKWNGNVMKLRKIESKPLFSLFHAIFSKIWMKLNQNYGKCVKKHVFDPTLGSSKAFPLHFLPKISFVIWMADSS